MSGPVLVGRAAAFPSDLGLGADGPRALSGDDAWALLFGGDWEAELERRGLQRDRARERHGVVTREWLHAPGAPRAVERGTERLAVAAAERALADARRTGAEVDLVVVASSTPDRVSASLAARVCQALGCEGNAFDVRAGGAAAILGWAAAARWPVDAGRCAVVVAAETPSAYLSAEDPANALLFGDGAAALVLHHDPDSVGGLAALAGFTRAAHGRPFSVPGELPPRADEVAAGAFRLQAPDAEYRAGLARAWAELATQLRGRVAALPPREATLLANAATRAGAEACARDVGLSPAPALAALARHGACGAASCLIALAELDELPARTVLAAVGGGVHAAGLVWDA